MNTNKYHNERGGDEAHGGSSLFWPGTIDGFPVKNDGGLPPDLKKEETENLDLQLDFKSKLFDLSDPAQKEEFDNINDKIVNGWYSLQRRSDHWDDENKHFRVWLEWAQIYGALPKK